jgi:hypothetical protein
MSALAFFLSCFAAMGAETTLSETNLIPENISLWTESMLWDEQISLSSGLGYNNNVLLSALNPHGSAFFINGLDLTVLRIPLDGWQVVGAVTGDDIRYWHNVGTSREDSFVTSLRVERELPDGWQAGLEARALYEDQVLDISTSLGVPTTALVEGYGITGQPSLRKNFNSGLWLQLEVPITRWYLAGPLDDYWDFGPDVTMGFDFGRGSDVTVSYAASYQPHDEWVALDAYGNPLPQHLEIFQDQAELAWHQYWDSHRRWRSATRLIFTYKEDNGGGYFNYYQYQVVEDLRWQSADWEIKGSAQLASRIIRFKELASLNGETLYRNFWICPSKWNAVIQRFEDATPKLEYQRVISNEAASAGDYSGTTVSGGLRWEF